MSNKGFLNCLEKRDLLNRSAVAVETLLSRGRQYEEDGMLSDAVDFYQKAGDKEALSRLLGMAGEEGDVFLLGRISRLLEQELNPEDWLAAAGHAEALGKTAFAAEAYRRAGRETPGESA